MSSLILPLMFMHRSGSLPLLLRMIQRISMWTWCWKCPTTLKAPWVLCSLPPHSLIGGQPHSCVHMRGYMLCFVLYCSEDDYDVFGLWRKNTVAGKLSSKELPKHKQKCKQLGRAQEQGYQGAEVCLMTSFTFFYSRTFKEDPQVYHKTIKVSWNRT